MLVKLHFAILQAFFYDKISINIFELSLHNNIRACEKSRAQ